MRSFVFMKIFSNLAPCALDFKFKFVLGCAVPNCSFFHEDEAHIVQNDFVKSAIQERKAGRENKINV